MTVCQKMGESAMSMMVMITHTLYFLTEIYIPSIEIEVQNIKKVEVRYNTKYFLSLIK